MRQMKVRLFLNWIKGLDQWGNWRWESRGVVCSYEEANALQEQKQAQQNVE